MKHLLVLAVAVLGFAGVATAAVKPDPLYWAPAKANARVIVQNPQVYAAVPRVTTMETAVCTGLTRTDLGYPMLSKRVNGELRYRHFQCVASFHDADGKAYRRLVYLRVTQALKFCWAMNLPSASRPWAKWTC